MWQLREKNMLRSFTLAGVLLLGLTLPTLAHVATTTGVFVNIRSGPGTAHPVIGLAWPGVRFPVKDCGRNWCAVSYGWMNGFISTHHIQLQH